MHAPKGSVEDKQDFIYEIFLDFGLYGTLWQRLAAGEAELHTQLFLRPFRASLEEAILSRYLPESELRRLALHADTQLKSAVGVVLDRPRYDALLSGPRTAAEDSSDDTKSGSSRGSSAASGG